MPTCHVRDAKLNEEDITRMSLEEKCKFLQEFVDELFFDEKSMHLITSEEWSLISSVIRDAPMIVYLPEGFKSIEAACAMMYQYYLTHKPWNVEDSRRVGNLKKWATIYGLKLESQKQAA